ncbi:putative GNAT family acetyltransferase [Aspergillus campestris IBT 28561]|uniref:GNAT family acetyltransferase n=1 Tax=Aspergillus campestris (strain IBT 28561) TaxID=1392248 RepID=A0A2I1D4M4_ASPC2|nr:putative GNAT family acetyltransferase [Aspergillus campestris IBT 28561]PKY04816.1 putative GNAT family acetyltransferase [Aspergillus campestris IBT 28561]
MSTDYEYSFFRIAKEDVTASTAQKYKQLRLHALSVAPTSFSSTYEIESAFADTEWINRLTATGKETFICAATPTQNNDPSDSQSSLASTWIGQLTLRGPQSPSDFALPPESGQKSPTGEELWQMLSLFTLPEHCGRGLGKKLCQEALNYLASYKVSPREVLVRLMVKPENHATVSLYRGLGFAEVGKCTLAEALVANGDGHLLPGDVSGEKYSARSGLIMVLGIRRG